MMKRVSTTRIRMLRRLAVGALVAGLAISPALARVEMSAGQAGDPTDGLDADSGGSSTQSGEADGAGSGVAPTAIRQVILVPVNIAGVLVFRVIVTPILLNPRS
jgi:hypothetical protein